MEGNRVVGTGLQSQAHRQVPRSSHKLRVDAVCWFLRRFARLEVRGLAAVPALRRRLQVLDQLAFHPPTASRHETQTLAGVPCDWVTQGTPADRVVLYLHGGGFAFHLPRAYRAFAARLSVALRARVLLPDYRLAPEHPFPAPQDDVLALYRALLAQGVPAGRIVLAGDSAGGNLSLGLLQRLRDEGLPQPACAVVLSPPTDLSLPAEQYLSRRVDDPVLDAASFPLLRDMAFAPEHLRDPAASPLLGRFDGLAPTLLLVGAREVLLEDTCRYAQRAHEAGAHVEAEVWDDMPHVFPLVTQLRESARALARIAAFADPFLRLTPDAHS